jgi:succinate dehydrogenase/fumarate reductase flavoprotein subunit
MTGEAAARHALGTRSFPGGDELRGHLDAACGRLDTLRSRKGGENPYQLRRELWETMDAFVNVYRDEPGLRKAADALGKLRERSAAMSVSDPSDTYNTNLRDALEIGNMIELAQAVTTGATERRESRGSHARTEYPARDDVRFLAHTLAYRTEGTPRLSRLAVAKTRWEPTERRY